MKNNKLISIILCTLLFTVGCSSVDNNDIPTENSPEVTAAAAESKNEGSKVLEDKIAEQKSKIESLEILNKEYSDYLNSVLNSLDEDKKQEIAESRFQYKIKVNEESIPKDGMVKVSKGTFKVTISEELLTNIAFPPNFPEGDLSGEHYSKHMVFVGQDESEVESYDGTMITAVEYTFEEGYSFDSLEIQITDDLKERLSLETNIIKIIVE